MINYDIINNFNNFIADYISVFPYSDYTNILNIIAIANVEEIQYIIKKCFVDNQIDFLRKIDNSKFTEFSQKIYSLIKSRIDSQMIKKTIGTELSYNAEPFYPKNILNSSDLIEASIKIIKYKKKYDNTICKYMLISYLIKQLTNKNILVEKNELIDILLNSNRFIFKMNNNIIDLKN